jgi:hypothetical protein
MSLSKIFVRKESSKQTHQAEKWKNCITQVESDNKVPLSYTKPPLLALITGSLQLLLRNLCGMEGIHNKQCGQNRR